MKAEIACIVAVFMLSVAVMAGTGIVALGTAQRTQELADKVARLENTVVTLSEKSDYCEKVMTTYQFFNEKWSKRMLGEE